MISGLSAADAAGSRDIIDGNQHPPDLLAIGRELSLHGKELGMGGYEFAGRRVHFSATLFSSAGNCLDLGPGERPPKPPSNPEQVLMLSDSVPHARTSLEAVNAWNDAGYPYHVSTAVWSRGGEASLRAAVHLEHGITRAALKDFVQRFAQEIKAFDRHLKDQHH